MSKGVIIVESPTKVRTIKKFLKNEYTIKASMGHIRDLPKKELGVDLEDGFKPKYVVDRSRIKQKVLKELREAVQKEPALFLASDPDREGEAIAWHLVQTLKKEIGDKPVYRIVFNEITKKAVTEAIEHPGQIDIEKVDAQQARRILDRIVGYTVSPVLWKVLSGNLSAGRVQSVALRIICEREDEIQKFVPVEYWTIEAILSHGELPSFRAVLQKWDGKKPKIDNEEDARALAAEIHEKPFLLHEVKRSTRKVQPSPAFITSTMQQDASRLLNFSPKKTMSVAQELYEGVDIDGDTIGLISYMRTDSLRISEEALDNCRKTIVERYGEKSLNPKVRTFKNKNRAQDAHEAIRPTDTMRTPEALSHSLTRDQLKLYTLIWQRFMATQMKPVTVDSVTLSIPCGKALFSSTGSVIRDQGFLLAYPHTRISTGENIDPGYLDLATDTGLDLRDLEKNQHFTKPPARFTEASLIKELESLGIGRPSTYASIVNTILQRSYVILREKKFHPLELGVAVNQFLTGKFDELFNTGFTADMENRLDNIEYGKQDWRQLLQEYFQEIKKLIGQVDTRQAKKELQEETDIECDKCGAKMVIKWGKKAPFLACPNYPECNNTMQFKRKDDGEIEIIKPESVDESCPKCGSELVVKSGRFGKFIACSNYPKCKFTKPFTTGISCPECKQGELVERKNKKGRTFFGCSRYPDCKFISNYKPVETACPSCDNPWMEERADRGGNTYLYCPKCKHKTQTEPEE